MKKPFIVGNWKMHCNTQEAKTLLEAIIPEVKDIDTVDIAVAPPFTSLETASTLLQNTKISLAAQNVHFLDKGAYTGEISANMLKHLNVKYVIIGHSERRTYFGETDSIVTKKVTSAIKSGLLPIICVGEDEKIRQEGHYLDFIKKEVQSFLETLDEKEASHITIAYEPIWAIGTGKTASEEDAEEVAKEIRCLLAHTFSKELAQTIRILYGGSVNGNNIKSLLHMQNIDGALVGGASLVAKDFLAIINEVK